MIIAQGSISCSDISDEWYNSFFEKYSKHYTNLKFTIEMRNNLIYYYQLHGDKIVTDITLHSLKYKLIQAQDLLKAIEEEIRDYEQK